MPNFQNIKGVMDEKTKAIIEEYIEKNFGYNLLCHYRDSIKKED